MDEQTKKESEKVPCRLHAIVAAKADTAVVFRRGPSKWWHILKWDLKTYKLESGTWLKGTLYPRRSAISPDGKLICYFMLKGDRYDTPDEKWDSYFAVSKLPWATALVAWTVGSTWTTGCWFDRGSELTISALPSGLGKPFQGKYPGKVNLIPIWMDWDKAKFIQEMKTGWQLIKDKWIAQNRQYIISAFPSDKQMWPNPPLGLMKNRKNDEAMLVQLDFGSEYAQHEVKGTHAIEYRMSDYILRYASGNLEYLGNIRWADWDHRGNLLTASWDGCLNVYKIQDDDTIKCTVQHDLNHMKPEPIKSPAWARKWDN